MWDPHGRDAARFALLHDGAEAYIADVSRPLKRTREFAGYRAAEQRLQTVIYAAFGLCGGDEPPMVKDYDFRLLRTEQAHLMPPPVNGDVRDDVPLFSLKIRPWRFVEARTQFLVRAQRLGLR